MQKLFLKPSLPSIQTEIAIGRGFAQSELFITTCRSLAKRGAVLADANVRALASRIQKSLGTDFALIPVAGGEASKSRSAKEKLEDELLKRKCGRDSLLIAVGGGVTTDLVGYIASTYMRGVPLVLVPTTLLAMVDAAIGGKTGVDTPYGKNQIGTFYFPKSIFIDVDLLETLPEKEWPNGLAEIAKYGLIHDPAIWDLLEKNSHHWRKPETLETLILSSIRVKMDVVEKDPLEQTGLRRILNFGHTVGHALELLSHYEMDHGQAVAIGCVAESFLSHLLGFLPKDALERILRLYQTLGFHSKWPKNLQKEAFLEAMSIDKKSKGGEIRCVLIDRIGHCVPFDGEYCRIIKQKEIEAMVDWMEKNYR